MPGSRIARGKEEAHGLHPAGLGNLGNDTTILADCHDFAEATRLEHSAAARELVATRRTALERLRERYGDGPIPERVARAHGLARPRSDSGGRRARAQRERVLAAARALTSDGVPFTCADLARVLGDVGPGGAQRVRHAIAQLVRTERWPSRRYGELRHAGRARE
jgi:hypothetical protein